MKLPTLLKVVVCVISTLTVLTRPAVGQELEQCTLDQVSEALNTLPCTVSGAFVSPATFLKTITATCAPKANAETCHACFRKHGGKAGPVVKALIKIKVLPRAALSQFRIGLVTAEEATCAPKENEDDSDDGDNDDNSEVKPVTPSQH